MGAQTSSNLVEYIFKGGSRVVEHSSPLAEVAEFLRPHIKHLLVGDWVKYIAVTGSFAAEKAKDSDDIDLFIVVKNGRLWWYRGLLTIHPVISSLMRRDDGSTNHSRKLCINLIAQESGLNFEPDIFTFHELYFMYPVYNPVYRETILRQNDWVRDFGGYIKRGRRKTVVKRVSVFLRGLDIVAFVPQVIFMFVMRHRPHFKSIFESYRKGRIEFFPRDFKKDKIDLYNQSK